MLAVEGLEGKIEMGIDIVDIASWCSLILRRLVPVVKTISACKFMAVVDLT